MDIMDEKTRNRILYEARHQNTGINIANLHV